MAAGRVAIDFIADTKAFTPAVEQANRALAATEQQVRQTSAAAGQAAGGAGGFKALGAMLGEGSGLGMIGKLALGTGAVAGVTMLTRALADASEQAAKWSRELRAGQKALGDVALEAISAAPVLGDLHRTFVALADVIAPVGNAATAGMEAQAALTRQLRLQAEAATAGSDAERARARAAAEYKAALAQIADAQGKAMREGTASPELIQRQAEQQERYAAAARDAAIAAADKTAAEQQGAAGKALLDQLNAQADQLAYTSEQLRRLKVDRAGLTAEQRAGALALLDEIEGFERQAAAADAAAKAAEKQAEQIRELATARDQWAAGVASEIQRITESVATPAEKLEARIAKLNELRASGLSDDTYQRAAEQAVRDAEAAMKPAGRAAQLSFMGVEQAWSSFASAAAQPGDATAAATARATTRTADESARARGVLQEINATLRAAFGPGGGITAVFG